MGKHQRVQIAPSPSFSQLRNTGRPAPYQTLPYGFSISKRGVLR